MDIIRACRFDMTCDQPRSDDSVSQNSHFGIPSVVEMPCQTIVVGTKNEMKGENDVKCEVWA